MIPDRHNHLPPPLFLVQSVAKAHTMGPNNDFCSSQNPDSSMMWMEMYNHYGNNMWNPMSAIKGYHLSMGEYTYVNACTHTQ